MSEPDPIQHIQPALEALAQLKADVRKRAGKEGGNLNKLMLSHIRTIEGVLHQLPSVQSMLSVINHQAQLATNAMRNMSRQLALQGVVDDDGNGSDPDTIKGE